MSTFITLRKLKVDRSGFKDQIFKTPLWSVLDMEDNGRHIPVFRYSKTVAKNTMENQPLIV